MKAVTVVDASCEEIFELIMSMDGTRFEYVSYSDEYSIFISYFHFFFIIIIFDDFFCIFCFTGGIAVFNMVALLRRLMGTLL